MKINWPHYLEQAVNTGQTTQALARQIRIETGFRVNISEVRMRLENFKKCAGEVKEDEAATETADVRILDLCSSKFEASTLLRIRTGGIEFEFETDSPAGSVAAVLSKLKGVI